MGKITDLIKQLFTGKLRLGRDIGIDLKSGGEADFQQVGIHSGECQFVPQVD